jgi:hypothetical protein
VGAVTPRFAFRWSVVLGVAVVDRVHGAYDEALRDARAAYGPDVRLVYGPGEEAAIRFSQPQRRRGRPAHAHAHAR